MATIPSPPTDVYAVKGDTTIALKWTAPIDNGGAPIISYTVTPSIGTVRTTSDTYILFTGLSSVNVYSFTVTATNSAGLTSAASLSSNSRRPDPTIVLNFDALMPSSYLGSGSTWTSIANRSFALTLANTTFDNGIVFNGSNSTALRSGSFSAIFTFPSSTFSALYWINTSSVAEQQLLTVNRTSTNTNNQLTLSTTTIMDLSTGTTTGFNNTYTTVTVPTNAVTLFAFRKNTTVGTASINKIASSQSFTPATNVSYGSSDMNIGFDPRTTAPNKYFSGKIYAIKLFNTSISDTALRTEYDEGLTPSNPTNANLTNLGSTASLSWTAPTFPGYGQSPDYIITNATTSTVLQTITNGATTATIPYVSGNQYRVQARNIVNGSTYTSTDVTFTVRTVPNAPTGLTATSGNGQVTLSWSEPLSNGKSTIIGYKVYDGTATEILNITNTTRTATISPLINGTIYTFSVAAVNSIGTGARSSTVTSTPAAPPSVPSGIIATSGNTQATVSWDPPATNGSSITKYSVTRSPGNVTTDLQINTSGLLAYYDPSNKLSYSGSGSSITSLVGSVTGTLGGSYSLAEKGIRLNNSNPTNQALNVSHLQLPSLSNITTVSLWYYQHVNLSNLPYLLDGRTGGTGAFIYGGAIGSNWATGTLYRNGELAQPITWANIETSGTIGFWQNITLIANAAFTDNMTLFARYSLAEGPDVTFGPILIYNRAITQAENTANYNFFSQYFGLSTKLRTTQTGLTNGTTYTYSVTATNSVGTSPASNSASVVVGTPGAPSITNATAGNAQATVTFSAPAANGTAAITEYIVTSSPGGITNTGNSSPITVTGLTNGIAYTFTVAATNSVGTGAASTASDPVTPVAAIPSAPTIGNATAGNGGATLKFTTPVSNGGSAIVGYKIYANSMLVDSSENVSISTNGTEKTATITGLTNGTTYTFTVIATNSVGDSAASAASNPVTPATTPDAPEIETATAGNAQATLPFKTPSNGGSAIIGYKIYANGVLVDSSANVSISTSGTDNTATITGLTNGTTYTFTVIATNSVGDSAASAAPNSVTPYTVPTAPSIWWSTSYDNKILFSWLEPTTYGRTILGYKVQLFAGDTSIPTQYTAAGNEVDISNGNTSYLFEGLIDNVPYKAEVRARTDAGTGAAGVRGPVYTVTPPSAPTNVSAVAAGDARAIVSWTPSANNGGATIIGYRVTYIPGNGYQDFSGEDISSGLVDTGLTNGVEYTFSVAAKNAEDPAFSAAGAAAAPVTPMTTPGAPTPLTATPGDGQVTLTWPALGSDGGASITGYTVYDGSENPVSATVNVANRTALITGLTNGTLYTFRVAAINIVGTGAKSTPESATPIGSLTAPTNIRVEAADQQLTIRWDAPAAGTASTYVIYDASDSILTTNLQTDNATRTAVHTSLTNGVRYGYKVAAKGAANQEGPKSAAVYGVPANPATLASDVTTILQTQANGNLSTALPTLNTLIASLPTTEEKNTVAATTAQTAASNVLAANTSSSVATKIANVAATIVQVATTLPTESASSVAASFVSSIAITETLTTAEKVAALAKAANSAGQTSTAVKTAIIEAIKAETTFTSAPVQLDTTQTTALFASHPNVVTPPSTVEVIVASGTSVTLTSGVAFYAVMTPNIPYTFSYGDGPTKTITFDSSLNKLVSGGVAYSPGDSIIIGTNTIQLFAVGGAGGQTPLAPSNIPCFPPGVMIRTPTGDKRVETLKTGDKVLTAAGRVVPVRMHSYSLPVTTEATAPYFIPAGALGPKAPAKPLHLSPLHAFQVRPNVWWCAQQAVKVSPKIQQYDLGKPITYYHVECPNFLRDNLIADGVTVESFAGDQLTKTEARCLYKFNKAVGGYIRSDTIRPLGNSNAC